MYVQLKSFQLINIHVLETETSPKLTSQCMPLSGLGQFPFNSSSSTAKNRTKDARKLAFLGSKIKKFSGEGALDLGLRGDCHGCCGLLATPLLGPRPPTS